VIAMAEKTAAEPVLPASIEVDSDEILTEFAKVMIEWGHYKTAAGALYPTLDEAREAGRGRRTDRGSNTDPIPG